MCEGFGLYVVGVVVEVFVVLGVVDVFYIYWGVVEIVEFFYLCVL